MTTHTMLTDAAATDLALALIMEFGAASVHALDGDEIALSFELGNGAALSVHAFGDTFVSANIAQDELRSPVRALRGSTNTEQIVKACRRAVDAWLAARA